MLKTSKDTVLAMVAYQSIPHRCEGYVIRIHVDDLRLTHLGGLDEPDEAAGCEPTNGRCDLQGIKMATETATSPKATEFRVMVEPPVYTETWSEGIYVFHNANAKYLNSALFPDASHTVFINKRFVINVLDRFPI